MHKLRRCLYKCTKNEVLANSRHLCDVDVFVYGLPPNNLCEKNNYIGVCEWIGCLTMDQSTNIATTSTEPLSLSLEKRMEDNGP